MSALVYLASASSRRRDLLAQLSVPFALVLPQVEEKQHFAEPAAEYVQRLAREKATAGQLLAEQDLPVLGGDTIVVLDGDVLEKPLDQAHAMAMLRRLSGRSHQVLTAIALATSNRLYEAFVTTEVTFRAISEKEIIAYWHSGEPRDKAGGYGIQGLGGNFVRRINGSYSGVVGLPLVETHDLLREAGVLLI
ncbi:Maf family protein [Oceanisphaera avium]|uniref:dTTP/UTP pyrophosphatase n=1 Tax=Oceanisphaera avium TaxID=1903694 RepID=A0A1Y0CZP5_9GAMM|nr:Maf family protein [Oceanisphaera avium]ART80800.1 septum formation protein Maf [Oceanisphaera avium]